MAVFSGGGDEEVELTCLKLVENQGNATTNQQLEESRAVEKSSIGWKFIAAAFASLFFL